MNNQQLNIIIQNLNLKLIKLELGKLYIYIHIYIDNHNLHTP